MVDDRRRIEAGEFPGLEESPAVELMLESPAMTRAMGRWLAARSEPGDFVGLVGGLGAGKTTVVQGAVEEVDDTGRWRATSPTYSLVQVYETSPVVVHMDLYRLEGWTGLESIGYWDHLERRRGVVFVEWIDRIPSAWPGEGLIVELSSGDTGRTARIWADDASDRRLSEIDHSTLREFCHTEEIP